MFKETLIIKPQLDTASSKQMELDLSTRFARVATRFGHGLKSVIKGSFLGISLGLISRLLNPIEALQEKINKLLGEGTDLKDIADTLNSTPGQVKQAQDVAHTLGVAPDKFNETVKQYSDAIDKAKEELANPFAERSDSTIALKEFVGQKDKLQGFFQFLSSLKVAGQGIGRDIGQSERGKALLKQAGPQGLSEDVRKELLANGDIRRLTGQESRQNFEKTVFGQVQTGAFKKLIDATTAPPVVAPKGIEQPKTTILDLIPKPETLTPKFIGPQPNPLEQPKTTVASIFPDIVSKIKEPPTDKLNQAILKASELADKKRALDVQNQTEDFVKATDKLNGKMIDDIAKADKLQLERETKQLDSFDDLKKASIAIEQVKGLFIEANTMVSKGIGYLSEVSWFVNNMKGSGWWRRIFGGGGKD